MVDFNLEGCLVINIDNEKVSYEIVKVVLKLGDYVVILGLCLIDLFSICCIYDNLLLNVEFFIIYCCLDGYSKVFKEVGIMVDLDWIWSLFENNVVYVVQVVKEVFYSQLCLNVILCMSDIIVLELL